MIVEYVENEPTSRQPYVWAIITMDNGARFKFYPGFQKRITYNHGYVRLEPLNEMARDMMVPEITIAAEDMITTPVYFDDGDVRAYHLTIRNVVNNEEILRAALMAERDAKRMPFKGTITDIPPLEHFRIT